MQDHIAQQLRQALSSERLSAYQNRLHQDGNKYLFSHYTWNMALSESLYPALQTLEVTLRNALHGAIKDYSGQDDWFNHNRVIQSRDQAAVRKAREMLQRKKRPLEPGRMIAELNFGFWTSLFDKRYEQVLWPRLIKTVFPHMPKTIRTRKNLSKRFNKIRLLRNRIFHHEPIWYWQDLAQQHRDILEAIAWIEPAMKDLVCSIDRFPEVYQNGLDEIEDKLGRFC